MSTRWRVYRAMNAGGTQSWYAIEVGEGRYGVFHTWRKAFDYADRQARR